jgi:hypothetical protein
MTEPLSAVRRCISAAQRLRCISNCPKLALPLSSCWYARRRAIAGYVRCRASIPWEGILQREDRLRIDIAAPFLLPDSLPLEQQGVRLQAGSGRDTFPQNSLLRLRTGLHRRFALPSSGHAYDPPCKLPDGFYFKRTAER